MESIGTVIKPFLSVVVPVYNLENYIVPCVEGLLSMAQHVPSEIILVDDGSTDHSPQICDKLAAEYEQIKVIHKQNGGAADTRNTGIGVANGKYLMFVDGDDFIDGTAAVKVLSQLDMKKDIYTFGYYECYGEDDIRSMNHFEASQLAAGNAFDNISPLPMPWLYIVAKKYIEKYSIYMHVGLLDEDEEWTARLFAHEPTVETLNGRYYYYRRNRENSLTYGRRIRNTLADMQIIDILDAEKQQQTYSADGRRVLENKSRQMVYKVFQDLEQFDRDSVKKVLPKHRTCRKLLLKGNAKDRISYFLMPLLGYSKTLDILKKAAQIINRRTV